MDLGNFLIKHVVRELQHEFPNITQYATLSPIPGFRRWLLLHLSNDVDREGRVRFRVSQTTRVIFEDLLNTVL